MVDSASLNAGCQILTVSFTPVRKEDEKAEDDLVNLGRW